MKAAGPNNTEMQDVADALCRVEMFGGLCLVRSGERVSRFARQKAGMLLAYLALSPGPHSRERLLDLFWPDMDLPASRDNLSTALASLRRQIEPPGVRRGSVLPATHTQVGLNADAVTTDVAEFERLLDQAARSDTPATRVARRQQAVALYRDGFLPGCYEDWAVRASDRLEARLLTALEALARDQETLGALEDAQETARRRVELDAYSEDAHCEFIRLSVLAGHPQAGRAAWTRFGQTFASEFGAEPSPQTRARIEQLLAAPFRFSSPPGPVTETPAPGAGAPVLETAGTLLSTSRNPAAPPVVLSRFFGRETQVRQLINLLLPKERAQDLAAEWIEGLEPPCRLVTLTGPGGIGKTRLAVETAQRLPERLSVWSGFAGLAEATAPGQIAGRIASALGIAPSVDAPPLEQVAALFAARDTFGAGPAVLVLDNLEHLLAEGDSEAGGPDGAEHNGAEAVRLLLERVPSLTVLCTSRRRLGLRGERTFPVDPLPVPPLPPADITAESLRTLAESPSVRLYLDRAQAVRPDFTLTMANAPAVAALCRQLEGSPLALELAAAWVRTLPPRKMWERLTAGQDIPAGSYGDLPARHRSLSATLDWSRRLLTPAQQRLWARLSVFRGGWTVEAAEAVGEEPDAAILLAGLAEASLVTTTETESGEVRYGFLETVRAFGWARLQEEKRDEESGLAVARRHADYFGTLAATAEPNLRGPSQAEWLERLEQEHDNLRAVLTRHLAQDGAEAGMHLAVTLARFWNVRGHWREGGRWLNLALAHPRSASLPPALRARALNAAAGFTKLLGDPVRAQMLFEESLALRRQVGDLARVADTLHNLGYLALGQGHLTRARALYEESLVLCRQLDDTIGIADELHHLGLVAHEGGDLAEAQAWYEESLILRRRLGDERGLAITLHNLGNIACSRGDLVLARTLHEESLAVRRQIGDRQGIAESLCGLGVIALQHGDGVRAGGLFFESLALYRNLGDGLGVAWVLEGLAGLALAAGDVGRAGRLYGAASARRETLGMPLSAVSRQSLDQTLASVRGGPSADAFTASWEQGRSLTLEQAAEYAAGG